MREGLRTSLLSIVCVVAVSGAAFAAASVRNVGGAGTYPSAASAATTTTTAARAGSLRSGTYVRPTTTTTAAKSGGGSAPMTTTTTSRATTTPRLSIGKYVGAPKSISSPGGGGDNSLVERIESIERTITILENTKQEIIRGSDYIIVDNNEVILNVEKLIQDLEIQPGMDGRPVELDADNDEGIKWRYVTRAGEPEDTWKLLVTWAAVADRIDLTEMNEYVDNSVTRIKQEIEADLSKKVDKEQGVQYAGQVLTVDSTGHVTPGNVVYSTTEVDQFITNIGDDLDTKVDKKQGTENAGKVLYVNDSGFVEPGSVDIPDISGKVDVAQGTENAGKVLIVDREGKVTTGDVDIPDISGKVDVVQGTENAGKALIVNDSGKVDLSDNAFGKLAYKDTVGTDDIENGSVTRQKAAEDITGVLSWAEWWKENSPGEDALLSVDADGNQQWFYVVE